MKNEKRPYWKAPNWNPISMRRQYPFKISERGDWQDILSTYDCILEKEEIVTMSTD